MNNEDGACPIPTLVNGVTSINPNPKTAPKYSESNCNIINKEKPLMYIKSKSVHIQKNTE